MTETNPPNTMQPHQQRVIEEKSELDDKRAKLGTFINSPIFRGLKAIEREYLELQKSCMDEYSDILEKRIAAF